LSNKRLKLEGLRFGKLLVLEVGTKDSIGHFKFLCICDCGKKKEIYGTHLKKGVTKSCGCDRKFGPKHPKWTGFGEISGNWWNGHIGRHLKSNRKSRQNITVTITPKYMWELFLKQDRKCALSGKEITIIGKSGTASIDRIDCSKGYTEENVQWVHKDINRMKNIFKQEYFLSICKLIADRLVI
jgi:hypothetical protein